MAASYGKLSSNARVIVDLAYEEATKIIARYIELQRCGASAQACDALRDALAAYYRSADAKRVKGPLNRSLLAKLKPATGRRARPRSQSDGPPY